MNPVAITVVASLIVVLLVSVAWTIYSHRPKAPPSEPTLAEELQASIARAVRMRIMHEGDAEYELHMAKYFQAREARLREELEALQVPPLRAPVSVGSLPEGFLEKSRDVHIHMAAKDEVHTGGVVGPTTGAPA